MKVTKTPKTNGELPDEDALKFAARLAAVRRAYGYVTGRPDLPRAGFAAELGLAREAYRRYERGEVAPPMSVLVSIRRITGISLDYLVTDMDYGVINAAELAAECHASAAERIRWVRELFEPNVSAAAKAFGVPIMTYQRWEDGREIMPEEAQKLFAHRYRVSLQYLQRGLPVGIPHSVYMELRRFHPELWVNVGDQAFPGALDPQTAIDEAEEDQAAAEPQLSAEQVARLEKAAALRRRWHDRAQAQPPTAAEAAADEDKCSKEAILNDAECEQ
jgi:transcriptional regulator with XRE-family HTH domain